MVIWVHALKDDYVELKSIEEILSVRIMEKHWQFLMKVIFKFITKKHKNSCFVNNYFCDVLTAWEANMDIQPALNHCKAVASMCAHLSKSECECSVAKKQALQDAFEKELDHYEQMKSVANAYINKRECSIQECVYHILKHFQV